MNMLRELKCVIAYLRNGKEKNIVLLDIDDNLRSSIWLFHEQEKNMQVSPCLDPKYHINISTKHVYSSIIILKHNNT